LGSDPKRARAAVARGVPLPSAAVAVIELAAATVRRAHPDTHQRRIVMGPLDLRVEAGEHWVVLGPNGAGKTSLLLLAAAVEHPYSGSVTVLGGRLGHVDVREVREHIGFLQGRLVDEYSPWTSALDVMLGGATGTILVREELLTPADRARAVELLERFGCAGREQQRFGSLSEGERRRVLVARALMNEPPLLLLDEPTASLDLPGRETVIGALERLAADEPALATVTVVHHVEDIPACATHALLMREGASVAQGAIATALTPATLSAAFGLPIELHRLGRRLAATVTSS
jgi:iron complex transport system ATP-binding protein